MEASLGRLAHYLRTYQGVREARYGEAATIPFDRP